MQVSWNEAPSAQPSSHETSQARPITVTVVVDDDGVGDVALSLTLTTDATFGDVALSGTDVTYAPDVGYFGADFIEIMPSDGELSGEPDPG